VTHALQSVIFLPDTWFDKCLKAPLIKKEPYKRALKSREEIVATP
jgi:hypothetical protein